MDEQLLLIMKGKRIVSHKIVRAHEGSFEWVGKAFVSEGRNYALVSPDLREQISGPFCYFNGETIQPMKPIEVLVDKRSIESDGVDKVTYTLHTEEPMEIYIRQEIGTHRESIVFDREPVDGKIELTIDSDGIGRIQIHAVGNTVYADFVTVEVV